MLLIKPLAVRVSMVEYARLFSFTFVCALSCPSYQKMLFTLEQCDFSFQKTHLILEMNKGEMDRYSVLSGEIGMK